MSYWLNLKSVVWLANFTKITSKFNGSIILLFRIHQLISWLLLFSEILVQILSMDGTWVIQIRAFYEQNTCTAAKQPNSGKHAAWKQFMKSCAVLISTISCALALLAMAINWLLFLHFSLGFRTADISVSFWSGIGYLETIPNHWF